MECNARMPIACNDVFEIAEPAGGKRDAKKGASEIIKMHLRQFLQWQE